MPKDRRDDRHATKGRLIRPRPEVLWEELGQKVGPRERNRVISELIEMYLAGQIVLNSEKAPPEGDASP